MPFGNRLIWASAAAILLLSGCASPEAKEAKYLAKGKEEFKNKNYAVAILHFKNAATARPRDAEPHYQLGLAYLASNDINAAATHFLKASELNPRHTAAQLKLADLMSASGSKADIENAQKRALQVLTALPDDVEALDILAVTELRLGNPKSAEAHLEQALQKTPGDVRSSVNLAQTRLALKDSAGAEQALKQAVAHNPKAPDPTIYLGAFYVAQGKTAEAEEQYRQALKLNPRHGPALLALAELQLRTGKADQAEQLFREVSSLPEKQYKPLHARFLLQTGKRDQAIAEFEKLVAADAADRNVRTELVQAYLASNRMSDAERVLTTALTRNRLDSDALMQRSRIYLASGKYAQAQEDLNQVLHFQKNSGQAHYFLSKVSEARGDSTIRKQELGEALRLEPALLEARVELAQLLLSTGGAQSALQLLDQTPQQQKSAAGIVVQRNWALMALGRGEEARKGIDEVLSSGKIPDGLLQDAALKLAQKNYAGARASAERALGDDPENIRALRMLVQTYIAQNQMPAAIQKVREYAAKRPGSGPVQHFFGRLLFSSGDRAGARQAFEAAKASSSTMVSAELSLAEMDTTEGKRDDARKRLSGVLASQPANMTGHLLMAQLELAEGKAPAAIEQYRKALSLDSRNALALNGLAYLLADSRQPDEALKYAQQAKELAPDNPAVDDTLGWTYYQKGMYSLAVTHLESATGREDTPRRKYHLAMAYSKAGDARRARQAMDSALKMDPNLPEAQLARQVLGSALN